MANKILWDARPTGAALIGPATSDALCALANNGNAISEEYANGTNLNTYGDFLLRINDFAAAPTAGGYFELHLVYEMGTIYADGEDGDLAGTPNLTGNTLAGVFPIKAADEDQVVQLCGVPLRPHDFKAVLTNKCGQNVADSTGNYLTLFPYCDEVQ